MPGEVIELGLKLSTTQLDQAGASFDKTTSAATKTQGKFDDVAQASEKMENRIRSSIDRLLVLAATFFSFEAVEKFIDKVTEVATANDKLTGTLVVVTGSLSDARAAFQALQEWADKTPFSINDVINAFTRLKLAGIAPTNETMQAFGNIAATLHVPLNQFADAVSMAMEGMFRGLTQYGIKITQFQNQLFVNFQGNITKMKNNGTDLLNYLVKLGNTKFASGMSAQMDTLAGAQKELADATEEWYKQVGDSGFNQAVTTLTQRMTTLTRNSMDLATEIGEGLAGAINEVLYIMDMFNNASVTVQNVIKGFALYAVINAFIALADVLGVVTMAQTLLNIAMRANPFSLFITGIVAVIQYAGGLQHTLLDLEAVFIDLKRICEGFFVDLVSQADAMAKGFAATFKFVGDSLTDLKGLLVEFIKDPFTAGADTAQWAQKLGQTYSEAMKKAYAETAATRKAIDAQLDAEEATSISKTAAQAAKLDKALPKSAGAAGGGIDQFAGGTSVGGGNAAQRAAEAQKAIDKYLAKLQQENSLVTQTADQRERMKAEFELENQLKSLGLGLDDQTRAKVDALIAEHQKLIKETSAVDDLMKSLEQSTTDSLAQMFKGGSTGMHDMLKSWGNMLADWTAKMVERSVFQPLFDAVGAGLKQQIASSSAGSSGGGGFLSVIGNAIGSMFHFADGGAGVIGGVGGIDSQTVSFKGTPGEQVFIKRPGDTGGGSSGTPTVVNVYNNGQNTQATVQQRDQGKTIDVYIDQLVSQKMSSPNSSIYKTMRGTFGNAPALTGR